LSLPGWVEASNAMGNRRRVAGSMCGFPLDMVMEKKGPHGMKLIRTRSEPQQSTENPHGPTPHLEAAGGR
jgi:hypothetical protein